MGYSTYPKKTIILVICPLKALIESHMKEFIRVLVGNRRFDWQIRDKVKVHVAR